MNAGEANREREAKRKEQKRKSWKRMTDSWAWFNSLSQADKDAERARQGLKPHVPSPRRVPPRAPQRRA